VLAPEDRCTGEIFRHVEPEDLLKYDLIPEFVGRLPVVDTLEDLDETSLKKILTDPKNALVKQYQRLFEMENIDLTFADETRGAVARKVIERKTGRARSAFDPGEHPARDHVRPLGPRGRRGSRHLARSGCHKNRKKGSKTHLMLLADYLVSTPRTMPPTV